MPNKSSKRGGKRRKNNPSQNQKAPYSQAPNPYEIPDTIRGAIGTKGAPMSMTDAFFDANPYYSDNYREFSENCQRAVFAYEMRRRGYDVEALPTYENDEMPRNGNWMSALKGLKAVDVGKTTENATIKNIEKQMASWGNGARAIVRVKWAGGNSGHVFNAEYNNGRLYIFDAQSNRRTTGVNYLKQYLPYATLSRTQLVRTDQAPIADNMRYMVKKK